MLVHLPARDPHAGGCGRGGGAAVAPGEGGRGAGAAKAPAGQPEGEGAGQGHPRDIPDPPALHEGRAGRLIVF